MHWKSAQAEREAEGRGEAKPEVLRDETRTARQETGGLRRVEPFGPVLASNCRRKRLQAKCAPG